MLFTKEVVKEVVTDTFEDQYGIKHTVTTKEIEEVPIFGFKKKEKKAKAKAKASEENVEGEDSKGEEPETEEKSGINPLAILAVGVAGLTAVGGGFAAKKYLDNKSQKDKAEADAAKSEILKIMETKESESEVATAAENVPFDEGQEVTSGTF